MMQNPKYAIKFTNAGPTMAEIIGDGDKISDILTIETRKSLFTFDEAKLFIAEWFKTRAVFVENLKEEDYANLADHIGEERHFQNSLEIGNVS